jgi:hypothetical protein
MQRTWVVVPVAAVTVLAVQFAAPVPATRPAAPPPEVQAASFEAALAEASDAVHWECALPHRATTQRALRSESSSLAFVEPAGPNAAASDLAAKPITGFGTGPGQNPQVKVDGTLAGADSVDTYAVPLHAGEVFSATVRGAGGTLQVRDPKGQLVEGSSIDRSGIYPTASPLLGGGNATVDHVAAVTGTHTLTIRPSKPDATPEGTDAKPDAGGAKPEPDAKPDVKPDATPEAGGATPEAAGAKPDASPDAKPDVEPDVKPDVKPDANPDAKPDADPDAKPEATADANSDPKPNAAAGAAGVPVGTPAPTSEEATGTQPPNGTATQAAPNESATQPAPAAAAPAPHDRSYQAELGIFRPTAALPQKIVLEFAGATIDTRKFGLETANNQVKLSGLTTFLPRFGLTAADRPELVKRITDTVRENLVAASGGGPVDVTSADNAGASGFGTPGVSRVLIGGSSQEAGISTVGISESVDPGNFAREETALVLLDRLSGPVTEAVSLSHYLPTTANHERRVEFVGRALGNIASHEAGHFLGSWHTDTATPKHDLMAPGDVVGAFGFGADKLGGTPDDVRSQFGQDTFAPQEGFTGTEDTRNRTLVGLRGVPSPG